MVNNVKDVKNIRFAIANVSLLNQNQRSLSRGKSY